MDGSDPFGSDFNLFLYFFLIFFKSNSACSIIDFISSSGSDRSL